MESQKIINLLDTDYDNKDLSRFSTRKWIEIQINQKKVTILTKKLELRHQC